MKKLSVTFLFALMCAVAFSQSIGIPKNSSSRGKLTPKRVMDQAQFVVSYNYTFVRDPEKPLDTRQGVTLLEIGSKYNRFCDAYEIMSDSISDAEALGKLGGADAMSTLMTVMKKRTFNELILIDIATQRETVQRTAGLTTKYQYTEDVPVLNWAFEPGDTLICGYHCQKATASLFGRNYVAWFSPEVDMPYGPYKFNGLPGLVFKVGDADNHHVFELTGIQKVEGERPIYLWTSKDIVKTDRATVRKIYKNFCADPMGALTSSGAVVLPESTKASVKSKPYNPIELE